MALAIIKCLFTEFVYIQIWSKPLNLNFTFQTLPVADPNILKREGAPLKIANNSHILGLKSTVDSKFWAKGGGGNANMIEIPITCLVTYVHNFVGTISWFGVFVNLDKIWMCHKYARGRQFLTIFSLGGGTPSHIVSRSFLPRVSNFRFVSAKIWY
jgi:hypothetical protein